MKIKLNLVYLLPLSLAFIIIPLFLFRTKSIVLIVNGESSTYETRKLKVETFLSEVGFSLNPLDKISSNVNSSLKNINEIKIEQFTRYTIHNDSSDISMSSTNRLIGNVLAEAEIQYDNYSAIYLNGQVSSPSNFLSYAPFYDISVYSSFSNPLIDSSINEIKSISLEYQSSDIDIPTSPNYPLDLTLSISGTSPQQYNYLGYLDEFNSLSYTRVIEEVVIEQYPINFSTIYQPLSTILLDTQATIQPGEFGLEAQRNRIRYENGLEIRSTIEDTWLVRPAVNRVVGYGTDISIQSLSTPDGTIEYYRAVEFYATSYSPSRSGVDPSISWYGQVYCGGYTQFGYVAVDLDYVPCGTSLYIPGYGYATAMDTGNFDGAWIDLGYDDDNWIPWSTPITVYFLTPVPPIETIQHIIPPGSTPFLPGFTY